MRKDNLKDFLLITIGILLVAISVVYFFDPNNIAAGGITGLAIVINHYIPIYINWTSCAYNGCCFVCNCINSNRT